MRRILRCIDAKSAKSLELKPIIETPSVATHIILRSLDLAKALHNEPPQQ